jgi:hypothetical protein
MRTALVAVLLVSLHAQSVPGTAARADVLKEIISTLTAMKSAAASQTLLSDKLTDEIMSLVRSDARLARTTVAAFSHDLTSALVGKEVTSIRAETLQRSIRDVVGTSAATFPAATSLREALTSLGIDPATTQGITRRFMAIGEGIRGPDDIQLLMPMKLRR